MFKKYDNLGKFQKRENEKNYSWQNLKNIMEKRKYLDGQQEEYKEIRKRKEEYKDQEKEGRI